MLALFILDSAEHTVLEALVEAGRMPTLAALAARGRTVPLASDGDTLDGSVFQTLLTGVNPGRHGIHKYQQLVPGTYAYALSKAAQSPEPQLWNVFSEQGLRCCVFDPPKAFPTPGFNGRMIASWGSYSPAADPGCVPDTLYDDLTRRFGAHPMRIQHALPLSPEHYARARQTLVGAARLRTDAALWMLDDGPWDFVVIAYSESHVAAHQFWQLRDPAHPLYDGLSAERCGEAVEAVYEAIDAGLARLLEALPDDAHVVVLTQQGVEHNYSGSHLLPPWLARRAGRPYRRHPLQGLDAVLPSELRNRIRRALPERATNSLVRRKFPPDGPVYMLPGSEYGALLRVNLEGREPAGVVHRAAYRDTLDALCADLLRLENPATGRPAVRKIVRTHDVYDGPRLDDLPDAVVCWRTDRPITALRCPQHGLVDRGISFTDITHSKHTDEGLAVFAGPGMAPGRTAERHDLRDLTATLYTLAGLNVPGSLEGRTIDDWRVGAEW